MIEGGGTSVGFAVGALLTGIWDDNLNMPPAGNSFLSAANLSGKLAAHFCTHAGSGLGTSDRELRAQAPNAQFLESLSVVGTEVDHAKVQIENWVRRVLNR